MKTHENRLGPRSPSWGGVSFYSINSLNFLERMKSWSRAELLSPFVLGANCCARELYRLSGPNPQVSSIRENFLESEPIESCDVLIISGIINKQISPYILEAYERMLSPRYVIAVGTCAATGAVFETMASDEILPVDVYVGGCPPTLDTLMNGLDLLRERIRKGIKPRPQFIDGVTYES
ncbi:MAG: hypothetical protein K9K67_09465 [Bacteriovoracaceae bacterium]|nr:hypothetical protein [Bacteriovoracaceae bacterium]